LYSHFTCDKEAILIVVIAPGDSRIADATEDKAKDTESKGEEMKQKKKN